MIEISKNETFLHLLYRCRDFKCSDPRDKIFVFLGIQRTLHTQHKEKLSQITLRPSKMFVMMLL